MIGGGVLAVLLLLIVMVEEGKHKAKLGDTYGTKIIRLKKAAGKLLSRLFCN